MIRFVLLPLLLVWACGELPTTDVASEPQFARQGPPVLIVTVEGDPAAVAQAHGITPRYVYTHVLKGFAASVPELARAGLMKDARVRRVEDDGVVTTMAPAPSWGIDRIDQRSRNLDGQYNPTGTGAGVTAYIVDTGIRYDHVEFGGRASPGWDVDGLDGSDCHGHGTHVAGTTGGATFGVARAVSLVSVKVFPQCGGFTPISNVVAAMDWIAANATLPAVVNMSIGSEPNAAMDEAVQALVDAGMAVAVAAGNSYSDACDPSPARSPNALTVAASDATDRRADFSNFGRCVDFFAPGVAIISASHNSSTGSRTMSGTSMAAPHVAGAAALMLEMEPSATPARVREMLWDRLTAHVISDNRDAPPHLLYVLGESGNPPPPWPDPIPGIFLTATGYKVSGVWHVVLEWVGMGPGHAKVYRDGVLIAEDISFGSLGWRYADWLGTKGSTPSHVYRVCDETDAECSNHASVGGASGKKAGGKK